MAMKDRCVEAVNTAAGRKLKKDEIDNIEKRIIKARWQLGRQDPEGYSRMTPEQQLQAAAKIAAENIVKDAVKKEQRLALSIQKHALIDDYIGQQKTRYGMSGMESLQRFLAVFDDGKSHVQSVESRAQAISADYTRQLLTTFESMKSKVFGLFKNKEGVEALTRALFNEDLEGKFEPEIIRAAKDAVQEWDKITENAKEHFNNAGGNIADLEDWRRPQNHSQRLVANAADSKITAENQAKWVKDIYGKLDRSRYIKADGSFLSDNEFQELLKNAWLTIATGGTNKLEPGKFAKRETLADIGSKQRVLHFKDADSYIEYQSKYGRDDAYTAMMKHIRSVSHDIAMIEKFGPDPDSQFRYWLDKSVQEDNNADPNKKGANEVLKDKTQRLYDHISGKAESVANWRIAQGFDTLRNWLVATRLGSAYITSITDNATMQLTAAVNEMSHMQLLKNQLKTLDITNTEELKRAQRSGLSLQTFIGEINRWGAEALGPNFSNKMANLTLRASFLNAATEARRRAFGVTMYGSIGDVTKKYASLSDIEGTDHKILKSKGVTDTDFKVWKAAQLEDWGGGNDAILTPDSIYSIPDDQLKDLGNPSELRREAALKLMGLVNEEINMAVIEPGARTRAMMKGKHQRGTLQGELTRSFWLFKSFPIAAITKHWARALSMDTNASKALYLSSFIAGTTVLGSAAQQISNLVSGRDPQDMTKGKFWASSLLKGGSLGIYGDFLFNTSTQYGSSPLATLAGPVAGYIEELLGLTQGNLIQASKGKKTSAGAESIKFLKSNIPLQNLWYTKAATDRLIFNQLQEMVSPGYMRRIEQRARKDFNQSYFWRPGEITPKRGPDLEKVVGE